MQAKPGQRARSRLRRTSDDQEGNERCEDADDGDDDPPLGAVDGEGDPPSVRPTGGRVQPSDPGRVLDRVVDPADKARKRGAVQIRVSDKGTKDREGQRGLTNLRRRQCRARPGSARGSPSLVEVISRRDRPIDTNDEYHVLFPFDLPPSSSASDRSKPCRTGERRNERAVRSELTPGGGPPPSSCRSPLL